MSVAVTTIGLLVASLTSIICEAIPYADSDRDEILEFARDFVSDSERNFDQIDIEFEMCQMGPTVFGYPPRRHVDKMQLTGFFPNSSESPDARIQEKILCEIRRTYVDNSLERFQKNCGMSVRVLLEFPGVSKPITVDADAALDGMRDFLKYLFGLVGNTEIYGETFSEEDFSSISRISSFGPSPTEIYGAMTSRIGTGQFTINAIRTGEDGSAFSLIGPH